MTKTAYSFGRRLSIGLALHSFVVLASVCALMYLWALSSMHSQHESDLFRVESQVKHLVSEARQVSDLPLLWHKLDDLLIAQDRLYVRIDDPELTRLYQHGNRAALRAVQQRLTELTPRLADAERRWTLQMALDTRSDVLTLRLLGLSLAGGAAAGSILISIGAFVLVRRGLSPIQRLAEQAQALTAHRPGKLDGQSHPVELKPLVDQFNALLGRLQRSYERLSTFNADLAHEMGTPLATLIGGTEIALRRPRPVQELRDLLESNLEELNRLARIVKDMLLLASADHGAHAQRRETVNLAALAQRVVELQEAILAVRAQNVQIDGAAMASVEPGLIEQAISNLLANASRYAPVGSKIEIEIGDAGGDYLQIIVCNSGEPIPDATLDRMFDRFYRADTARTHAAVHHGLGLAIVAAIAQLHGGEPFAESSKGKTRVGFRLAKRASISS